jgi:hypothetical protein
MVQNGMLDLIVLCADIVVGLECAGGCPIGNPPLGIRRIPFVAGYVGRVMAGLPKVHRSVSSSPVGSPANIARMLDFAARHDIKPIVEKFRFDQVNDAIAHLRSGRARYRIVLNK